MAMRFLKRLLPKPDDFGEIDEQRNAEAKRRHILNIDESEEEQKRQREQAQHRTRSQRDYNNLNNHLSDPLSTSEDEIEMARSL
jgi:hypothetical protein